MVFIDFLIPYHDVHSFPKRSATNILDAGGIGIAAEDLVHANDR